MGEHPEGKLEKNIEPQGCIGQHEPKSGGGKCYCARRSGADRLGKIQTIANLECKTSPLVQRASRQTGARRSQVGFRGSSKTKYCEGRPEKTGKDHGIWLEKNVNSPSRAGGKTFLTGSAEGGTKARARFGKSSNAEKEIELSLTQKRKKKKTPFKYAGAVRSGKRNK